MIDYADFTSDEVKRAQDFLKKTALLVKNG